MLHYRYELYPHQDHSDTRHQLHHRGGGGAFFYLADGAHGCACRTRACCHQSHHQADHFHHLDSDKHRDTRALLACHKRPDDNACGSPGSWIPHPVISHGCLVLNRAHDRELAAERV